MAPERPKPNRGSVPNGHYRGVAIYRSLKDDKGASHFYCDIVVIDTKRRVVGCTLSDVKKLIEVFTNAGVLNTSADALPP
jgi:hypothetical protein